MFYRPSVFEERGYETPTTLDEFVTLSETMQSDGLVPIALADQDGWPAMGTFDYLNMRTNGFDFHMSLMAGEEAWDSQPVKDVFSTWAELLPLPSGGALGRTWQETAQSLVNKEAGMYLLGMFVGQQFTDQDPTTSTSSPSPRSTASTARRPSRQVIITPLYRLFLLIPLPEFLSDSGVLFDSYLGIILIHVAFQMGFCVFVLSNYTKTLPRS